MVTERCKCCETYKVSLTKGMRDNFLEEVRYEPNLKGDNHWGLFWTAFEDNAQLLDNHWWFEAQCDQIIT